MYFQKARIHIPVLYPISNYLDVTGMSQWLAQWRIILSNSPIITISQAVITIKFFTTIVNPMTDLVNIYMILILPLWSLKRYWFICGIFQKILAFLKIFMLTLLPYILELQKWQLLVAHFWTLFLRNKSVWGSKVKYWFISFHFLSSSNHFNGFQVKFERILQNCLNLNTCVYCYNF